MKKLLLLFLVLMVALPAHAESVIEPLFRAFGDLEIVENYDRYHLGIDFFIYLMIFGSAINGVAGQRFGLGTAIGMALGLSFAMIVFEYRRGFSIGDFHYVALIVFGVIVLGLIYSRLRAYNMQNRVAIALGYVALYIIFMEAMPDAYREIRLDNGLLKFVMDGSLAVALIVLAYVVINVFRRPARAAPGGATPPPAHVP